MDQLPVAGYFRVSQARDGMSAPEMYRDDIERYCRYKHLELAHVFSDIDYSGYRGARERPALEELKLRRYEFSSVVIPKLSRFGRSVKDLVGLFDMFDRDGIALVFLDMNVDSSTSQGRLLRHVMAAFAEYESDVKSDYSKAATRLIARAGRPQGNPPFGYRAVGKGAERTLEPDPETSPVVREIFERYVAGETQNSLARELEARRAPGSRHWSRARVRILLRNPSYAAFRIYEGEEHAGNWPPLVSRETWDAAMERKRASPARPSSGLPTSLLAGLVVCGICGKNLNHGRSSDRGDVYRCVTGDTIPPRCLGGQVKGERLEELLLGALQEGAGVKSPDGREKLMTTWGNEDIAGRRAILGEAVARVVLLARPPGDRHGKGSTTRRSIRIEWTKQWSLELFGYREASSTLTPTETSIMSPRGKSWREWRKAKLLPR